MRQIKRMLRKIHRQSIALLTGISIGAVLSACAGSGTRTTVCVADPAHNQVVCNKTGDQKDNYTLPFEKIENYRCMPPADADAIEQELVICRGGRKGS